METLFREVTRRICGSLHLDEALYDVLVYLKKILPVDAIVITVYEYDKRTARVICGAYDPGALVINQSFPLSDAAWDAIKTWQEESRSETTPWIRDETHPINREIYKVFYRFLPEWYPGQFSRFSSITCALKIKEAIIGNLTLVAKGSRRYTRSHADIIAEVNEPFAIALSNALRIMELEQNNQELRNEVRQVRSDVMIGADGGLKPTRQLIEQVAPTMSHVLLLGETGTGKEVIANEIHKLSPRSNGPLVSLNCGAIPDSLVDAELFGHEKGSFTGALDTKPGRFERANNGTLFLDEVGELPPAAQTKLLRVIQTGEFERVGGTMPVRSDVRLICATHRNLTNMVRHREFREDLWYRLNVFPITIPPLRDRKRDIPAMVEHFIQQKCREMNVPNFPGFATGAMDQLMAYSWPGNVRELQNLIERALILSKGKPLSFPDIGQPEKESGGRLQFESDAFPALDDAVAEHIRWALTKCNGKIAGTGGAAELLSINPNTLRSKMEKLGIMKKTDYIRR